MRERAWLFADTIPRVRTLQGLAEVEELARWWLRQEPERRQILCQIAARRSAMLRQLTRPVPLRLR